MGRNRILNLSVGVALVVVMAIAIPLMSGCAAPAPTPEPAPEPIVLKAISAFPSNDPYTVPIHMFMDKVEERANGELIFDYVGGAEVIIEFNQKEAVAAGRIDLSLDVPSFAPGVMPGGETLLLAERNAVEMRTNGAYEYYNELHQEIGIYYLGFVGSGPGLQFNWFLKDSFETPEDLAGRKMGDGTVWPNGLAAWDMIPTTIAYMDLYSALERGVIDGAGSAILSEVSMHWYEVESYMLDLPFGQADTTLIINLDTYNSLPEHLQQVLKEAAIEVEQEAIDYYIDLLEENRQILLDAGMEFVEFSPQDADRFLERMSEAEWDVVKERHPVIGPELETLFRK